MYDIDLKQLISGHFLGTITKPLDNEDLFLIGSVAWANEMYDEALSWLKYAEGTMSNLGMYMCMAGHGRLMANRI